MAFCRSTDFEYVCAYNATLSLCKDLEKHVVHNGDGSIAAIYLVDPANPLVPISTPADWAVQGAAPCPTSKSPYTTCVAGVCTQVYKLTGCSPTPVWQTEAGQTYTPTGAEAAGVCGAAEYTNEQSYDVANIGLPTQTCTEIETRKSTRCDGTLLVDHFTSDGKPYTLVGVIRWNCPCTNVNLGVVTSFAGLV